MRLHTRGNYLFQDLVFGDTAVLILAGVTPRESQSNDRDGSDGADE